MNQADVLNTIARSILNLDSLKTIHNDQQDFSEQAIWNIKQALIAAYEAGEEQGYATAMEVQAREQKTEQTNR